MWNPQNQALTDKISTKHHIGRRYLPLFIAQKSSNTAKLHSSQDRLAERHSLALSPQDSFCNMTHDTNTVNDCFRI